MLLIEQSKEDIEAALESWNWLDFSNKSPFITTAFGDVFLNQKREYIFLIL